VREHNVQKYPIPANAGRKTWNTTTYLLGFTDSIDGENTDANTSDEQLLLVGADDVQVLPINDGDSQDGPALIAAGTAGTAAAAAAAAAEDLVHVVAGQETLWDIAKLTTGDATNWHVLADINDLGQSAMVFPGQELIIPADMVKQDFDEPLNNGAIASAVDDSGDISEPDTPQLAAATEAQQSVETELEGTGFEVNNGENLWNFSKRTTGNATNWQTIANYNGFTEQQAITIQPGQTIYVPDELVREDSMDAAENDLATESQVLDDQNAGVVDTTENSVLESASTLADDTSNNVLSDANTETLAAALPSSGAEITAAATEGASEVIAQNTAIEVDTGEAGEIAEAAYQSDDTLNSDDSADAVVAVSENANIPSEIKVSGTYYPKAVYNDADFSASLLTRVSPGTTLQVSGAQGTWYQVQTDKGVGYVNQRDIQN